MRCPGTPLLVRALALGALLPAAAAQARRTAGPDDASIRKAWSFLLPAEQEDLAARFAAEVAWLDTFQGRLVRHVLDSQPVDPGLLEPDAPPPFFDPREHAPGQPIPRKRLAPDDPLARSTRKQLLSGVPEPPFESAWRYDWGRGQVLRTAEFRAPQHVFENALRGYAPGADLVEALVAQALDRGEQRAALAAFGHAYTDREGRVFPGLTLYDAWGSGREIEMPDVDNLGLVHTLTGERGRWVAPIPEAQHDELYELVGALYLDARRYRGLREALARCLLVGRARLRDGYDPHLMRLHGLWEEHASDPARLVAELPDGGDWAAFMEAWGATFDHDEQRVARARARLTQLERDATRVRALLVGILRDVGAFERERRPDPPPPREPAGSGRPGGRR